ncbi:MAG: shikimate dehydrogenase [Pseudoprimorskyibacter sp.]|jgi:shikimate dehydrogenase|nr:shikimate dehydrogenase [Pseudoprimorskyibacter sp.]
MTLPKIPLAGVVGNPIAHSKSPRLHGYWLRQMRVPGHYVPIEVTPDKLMETLRFLPNIGFVGLNVTVPYKEKALAIADSVTDRATIIGAANTLNFRRDGKIHADNTDGYGFLQNIRQSVPDWDPRGGPAVVLGAGGASRAVVVTLLDAGVPEIRLTNRTRVRAEKMREDFGKRIKIVDWVQAGNVLDDATTVINTTSLGMTGKPEMRVPLDGLRPGTVVNDLVYAPLETRFLATARAQGCRVVDGLGMLLHQAVPGFERWFGFRPDVTPAVREAMLR